MLKDQLDNVRAKAPLIHNITNYVTVNDVANVELACGGSPIMTDDINDVEQITTICGGLNINIGTLNERTIPSMHKAGKKANELGHPVLLDPVGSGASEFRTKTALDLLEDVDFTVIRGNISEVKSLVTEGVTTQGVDADVADEVTEDNLEQSAGFAKKLAAELGSIIAITGRFDLVADKDRCFVIRNGRPEMSRITGTGCQLSGMTTAFLVANPDTPLEAAAAAVCTMGVAGDIAWKNMNIDPAAPEKSEGNSTYRNRIIDAIYNMDGDMLERYASYEII